ncbi:MAG: T9SS type A sorting domain-containing protein [bacterium]
MKKMWATFISLFLVGFISITAQDFWQQAEFPVFYNYTIDAIAAKNNLVLAYSSQDGLALSTDSGDNWFSVDTLHNFLSVAITNSGYLFAIDRSVSILYRSTDLGKTWLKLTGQLPYYLEDIIVDPSDNLFVNGGSFGVYRSTDYGETWTAQNNGINLSISKITNISVNRSGILSLSTKKEIYKSTDRGDSWFKISNVGAGYLAVNSLGHIFTKKFKDADHLTDSLYRTTDDGATWKTLKYFYGNLLFIDPENDAILTSGVGGSVENYSVSFNNGDSWGTYKVGYILRDLACNGECYFWGTSGLGIFRSNSLTSQWNSCVNGFPGSVTKVRSFLYNNGLIYAGTYSFGLYSSVDNGFSFEELSYCAYNINKLCVSSNGTIFSPSTSSTDNGVNWHTDISEYFIGQSLCVNDHTVLKGGNMYQTGIGKIYRSIDDGKTWSEVLNIPGQYNSLTYSIISLAINSNGTALGCVENIHYQPYNVRYYTIRSTDFGKTWNTLPENSNTTQKILDFIRNNRGEIFAITPYGPSISVDDGLTWNFAAAPASQDIRCIAINSIDNIYLGTGDKGVFVSSDDGATWNAINIGLTDLTVNTLSFTPEGILLAGTEHGGVFRSINSTTVIEDKNFKSPNDFLLSQNYPNPFNPTTLISYQLPAISKVQLKVYDVLGREIATLVDEEKPAGNYNVTFNGEGLPSGVYFYSLQAGDFHQTKKMLLLK